MCEEVEKHVLRKYELLQKVGKGVRILVRCMTLIPCYPRSMPLSIATIHIATNIINANVFYIIGQAYGLVWKCIDKSNKHTVALKKCFSAFRNNTDAQRTYRELMYLIELGEHDNIIRVLNCIKAENNVDLYVAFEFMGNTI